MRFPTTNATLLERLRDGEEPWVEFFRKYAPHIADIGRFKGIPAAECDDLVQEVMIRMSRRVEAGFRYDASLAHFRTYLNHIIKSCICDHYRELNRRNTLFREFASDDDAERPDELLDLMLQEKWRRFLMQEAIEELKSRLDVSTFQAFDLYGLQNRPVEEVTALLGISRNRVYVAKNRGMKMWREIIARLNAEDGALNLDD